MKRLLALVDGARTRSRPCPRRRRAARPTRFTDHAVSINLRRPRRRRAAAASSSSRRACPSEFGPGAFVDFWSTSEPIRRSRTCSRDFEQSADVTWNGSVLAGSIPLLDSNGDPVALGHVLARPSTPSGDPFPFDDDFRDGNRQVRVSGVSQPMDPSGTLERGRLDLLARWRASPTRRPSRSSRRIRTRSSGISRTATSAATSRTPRATPASCS